MFLKRLIEIVIIRKFSKCYYLNISKKYINICIINKVLKIFWINFIINIDLNFGKEDEVFFDSYGVK